VSEIAEPITPASKRLANVTARAALAGVTLYQIDGDFGAPVYVCSRWALTKSFDDLTAVEAWLDRVTGTQK
jgi:hypothetical protein